MRKIISTVWPWDHGLMTTDDVVDHALALGADEICIRTPTFTSPYNPTWHGDLARKMAAKGIDISIWPVVALNHPEAEADAILGEVERYNPVRVVIDAETKSWTHNLERFLARLGRLPVPVGLGSYRRANYHREMRWQVWLNAKVGTEYQIDFLAHQLYPIGWLRPESWVYQFRLDLDSHEHELARAGRSGMPWLPWMPSFIGSGFEGVDHWKPPLQAVTAAVEYMSGRLGSRLIGMNWWALDRHLHELSDLYGYVTELPSEGPQDPPEPPPGEKPAPIDIAEELAQARAALDSIEAKAEA